MRPEGTSTRKNGLKRYKFSCPKIKYVKDAATRKYHRHCICDNPCTTSECRRMVYVYPEKIFVLIQTPFVEPKNGIALTKSELLLKEISIT